MSMKLFSQSSGSTQHHERVTPVFVAQKIEAPLKKLKENAEKAASFNPSNMKNQEAVFLLTKVIEKVENIVHLNNEPESESSPSYRF